MNVTAQFSSQYSEQPSGQSSGQSSARSITAHPLFPTGMGVWFAVLFSLSSLAIRGSLLEALVVVTHIDYLFPAASPPLGAVPRAIMALLIAWAGYSVGRKVGLRIAHGEADATRSVAEPVYGAPPAYGPAQGHDFGHDYGYQAEAAPRRPFQVHEAVGGHYAAGVGAGEPGHLGADYATAAPGWGHDAAGAYQAPAYQAPYAGEYFGQYAELHPEAHPGAYAPPHQTHSPPDAQPYELGEEAAFASPHADTWQASYQPAYQAEPQYHAPQYQAPAAHAAAWEPPHPAAESYAPEAFGQPGGGYFTAPHDAALSGQPLAESYLEDHWPDVTPQPESAFAQHLGAPMSAVGLTQPPLGQMHGDLGQNAWGQNALGANMAHAPQTQPAPASIEPASVTPWRNDAGAPAEPAVEPVVAPAFASGPATQSAAERIAEGTLEQLSNVELMERLAVAMRRIETTQPAGAAHPAEPGNRAVEGTEIPAGRSALAALRGLK